MDGTFWGFVLENPFTFIVLLILILALIFAVSMRKKSNKGFSSHSYKNFDNQKYYLNDEQIHFIDTYKRLSDESKDSFEDEFYSNVIAIKPPRKYNPYLFTDNTNSAMVYVEKKYRTMLYMFVGCDKKRRHEFLTVLEEYLVADRKSLM